MPAMRQRWLFAAVFVAGCGTTDPDPRRPTTEVIVLEVLQPTCGQAQCHSQTTQSAGFAFDSIDRALQSIEEMTDAKFTGVLKGDPRYERMPPDSPLDARDLDLIGAWLLLGKPAAQP